MGTRVKYDILAADLDRNFHAILGYVFKNLNLSPFLCGLVQDIFHQIIHFGYICFEAFEFALVLSSLLLALKLKIKLNILEVFEYRFDARNSCIKTRSSKKIQKLKKFEKSFVVVFKKIY